MNMKKGIVLLTLVVGSSLFASDYGALGAMEQSQFTLEEMLLYALEDEHLALAEYQAIMVEFQTDRPYSNIAKAEETHIGYVEELYDELGMVTPQVDVEGHVALPSSLTEAAEIGVQAEINNIAMYEKFLSQDLPENVREVFEDLKASSEKHLASFERQVERGASRNSSSGTSTGNREGQGRGRNQTL